MYVRHSYVYKSIFVYIGICNIDWLYMLVIYNYWTMFSRKRKIILHFLFLISLSWVDPTTTRIEPASWHPPVYQPFSNNLLVARPWNSVEKGLAEWTVWSLIPQWWSESHGYIVVQWHVRIYTSHVEIARRRRKCTRMRLGTGVNNTDKYAPSFLQSLPTALEMRVLWFNIKQQLISFGMMRLILMYLRYYEKRETSVLPIA